MEWQPIETAPKDDAVWIIGWDGEAVYPITWVDDEYDNVHNWAYGVETWGGTLYEGVNEVKRQPTHWMPLPPPPTA